MPTHDYIIANGTGAAVRADINAALSAIVSLNSSASEPGTMYAYQLWADTTSNLLKIRNSANSAWITLRQLDGDFSIVAVEDGLQATPSLTFTNDLNTGIFRPGNDSLSIVTNALRAITITSTQAVGIQTANPSTALHVAGNARVGADDTTDAHLQIGKGATGNRNSYIDIVGDTTYTDYGVRLIRNNGGADATSEIKHRGTGAFNIVTQEAAPIQFYTSNSPRVAIDSSGRLLVGTSTSDAQRTASVQIASAGGQSGWGSSLDLTEFGAVYNPYLVLQRSRNGTIGSHTVLQNGDLIGGIQFNGSDGDSFESAATINVFVDGAPGANDMPGRLVFSTTADGASSPTEAMRINNQREVLIGTTTRNANGGILQLGSGITFPATAVAASDANTLDDYEEGTWTASITGGTFAGLSTGRYTKIGRQVFVYLAPSTTAISGNLEISGLPFTSADRSSMVVATTPPTGITYSPTFVDTTTIYVNVSGTYSGGSVSTYFACVYQV